MPRGLQLPFHFDPHLLQGDLAVIPPEAWTPHYNTADTGGDWSGVALRAPTAQAQALHAGTADAESFTDTPLLARCPYVREVLATFACPLKTVRLLRLTPGSVIREHSDPGLRYEDGEARLHIPIRTNPEVEFYVAGERLHLEVGSCYYINTSLPHRVSNRGSEDRIHLVIDAEVNAWVDAMFHKGRAVATRAPAPNSYEAFRRRLLGDPAMQQALHALTEEQAFLDAVVELGRTHGYAFDRTEVSGSRGLALHTVDPPRADPPAAWVPARVTYPEGTPRADWVYVTSRRSPEPFFADTLRHALRLPLARALRHQGPLVSPRIGLAPSAFIFHLSRCGSTLTSHMLAALDRAVSISEAPALDDVLHADLHVPGVSEEEQVRWVRTVVSALGQAQAGQELYFVKLDSWHIHKLPLLRRAFPVTPWLFLYRDPVEVLVSQLRSPGQFALPGAMPPAMLEMGVEDITRYGRADWCARVLAGFCRAALRYGPADNGLYVNYTQLPEAVWTTVARHCGVRFSASEITRMRQAASFDAKQPAARFQADTWDKQQAATATVRALADTLLMPLYRELEGPRGDAS